MEKEIKSLQKAGDLAIEIIINNSFQFFAALLILIIGWQLSKWIGDLARRLCGRFNLDITLAKFLSGIAKNLSLFFFIIIALSKFGITITPFIAALGAIIFGSTLALQGPISNYGAGLVIILTRPFVVGDTIRINAVVGIVEEIKLTYTILNNEDEQCITVPNNKIIGEVIYNSNANLIVEQAITISYDDAPDMAIKIIQEELINNPAVVAKPPVQVGIERLSDYGIEIGVRYWVPTKQYFEIKYKVNLAIYMALQKTGITIPYPRQVIELNGTST